MKSKFLKISSGLILAAFVFNLQASKTQAKIAPYYSGDAVAYGDEIFVGTANSGSFELFKIEGGIISKTAIITSPDSNYPTIYDGKLKIEGDDVYAYIVNGRYLYKYNVTNPYLPVLANKIYDSSWEWFRGVAKTGNNLAIIGKKEIKIMKPDFTVIDAYKLTNDYVYNLTPSANFIFNLDSEGRLNIYDKSSRQVSSSFLLYSKEQHNRKIYNDQANGAIYAVDDQALKKYDFSGNVLARYNHTSTLGYDVVPSINSRYLYFSDGIGVVKVKKENLKAEKWIRTASFTPEGSWAMGLAVASDQSGEKVIVFNSMSIVVLDANLKVLSSINAEHESFDPIASKFLSLDKTRAASDSIVLLTGGGYGLSEPLDIYFANSKFSAQTDNQGRFSIFMPVPKAKAGKYDVRVIGRNSKVSYTIGFEIE